MTRRARRIRTIALCASALALLLVCTRWCAAERPLRLATFNIEHFPKSERQVEEAFRLLADLDVAAVGVQEITDPVRFDREARERLGASWRSIFAHPCPAHRVGVVFDSERLELLSTRTHTESMVLPGARPAFEARFRPIDEDVVIRVVVLHLQSGGEAIETRRRQLRALRPVLGAAMASGERVIVLGDFNSTGEEDRREIAGTVESAQMRWASEDLECTAYWNRRDGCRGSALDHVLSWQNVSNLAVRGACESEGCDPADRCPSYVGDVSDHCPVTFDLP